MLIFGLASGFPLFCIFFEILCFPFLPLLILRLISVLISLVLFTTFSPLYFRLPRSFPLFFSQAVNALGIRAMERKTFGT